jgi:hypothetical protein
MWRARLGCGERVPVTRFISQTGGPWGRLRTTSIREFARPVRECSRMALAMQDQPVVSE